MTVHGKVLKYTLLPGFTPRIFDFFSSGFAHIAYLIAIIYQSLRLLPASHPYLNPQNIGRYGIRHVIAEAANNLVVSRKNIDQVIIFVTVLIGFVLLLIQFALLIMTLIENPVFASPPQTALNVGNLYSPGGAGTDADHPAQDLAFILLDRVFGTEGIFNSCVSQVGVDCLGGPNNLAVVTPASYPLPMHVALHTLLQFYSHGIFLVSVFIIIYFIISIVAETAETGTPFGQRYNKTWVPIRLIVFFALLTPLNLGPGDPNKGLNAAQLIVFWTAKTGSNFATNSWGIFNQTLEAAAVSAGIPNMTLLGDENNLVGTPKVPNIDTLTRFMFVVKTCQEVEEWAYFHRHTDPSAGSPNLEGINAYLVYLPSLTAAGPPLAPTEFLATPYSDALAKSNNGTITIRFGSLNNNSEAYKKHPGNIFPFCGEIKIPVPSRDAAGTTAGNESGAYLLNELYYQLLQQMWGSTQAANYAECILKHTYQGAQDPNCTPILDTAFRKAQINTFETALTGPLNGFVAQQITNGDWSISDSLKDKGWAGVSMWYNRIAEMNQNMAAAFYNLPTPTKYPYVMEFVAEARRTANANVSNDAVFDPVLSGGQQIKFKRNKDAVIAATMYNSYLGWANSQKEKPQSQGVFVDTINALFGTEGIFEMRSGANINVHPLAQLSSLGQSMMSASLRNLAVGIPGSVAAGKVTNNAAKSILQAGSSIATTLGTASLAMSFILAYVLPSLPFIYFIFAVSGWIKSIFEAVVAMPLWALAHITRIDGEGLPGPAATNGYFLILEIFLRPVLILFGLIASISIFSAMVKVLNDIFELVVGNIGGVDDPAFAHVLRNPVDEFFYTAMYVIICYMIGLGSFKLIDSIPNNILRWSGVTVSTIQEDEKDPGGKLSGKVYAGIQVGTGQIKGGALAAL